uniref:Testis expressed 22 n=1 Tax=Canis lupus familiaris TaxID=9615 RepID=A0A8C0RX58_CANLF
MDSIPGPWNLTLSPRGSTAEPPRCPDTSLGDGSPELLSSLSPQVCEPPESKRPTRHWSLSIEERRQLAVQGGWEEPGTTGTPIHRRDIRQLVARLVSEDVDRDVLLPHPLRSSEAALTFHAFLARSAPFWQRVTWAAQVSRSPPS